MIKILLISFLTSLIATAAIAGQRHYVPDDFNGIQAAINSSSVLNGDTVIVRAGTYYENINYFGKMIKLRSESGPEITIIDGCSLFNVVTFENSEGKGAVLDGFTITNGMAADGAGVFCGQGCRPIIINNIIEKNNAINNCGGLMISFGSPTVENNIIRDNEAYGDYGGGVYCAGGVSKISYNTISNNKCGHEGGGVFVGGGSKAVIENNIIEENSAFMGGGIFICSSSPIICGNVIKKNYGEAAAGGVCSKNFSAPLITGNIITENKVDLFWGGGIFCPTSGPTITSNIITLNLAPKGGGICCSNLVSLVEDNFIAFNKAISEGGGVYCMESNSIYCNNIILENEADIGGGVFCYNSSPILSNNTIFENHAVTKAGGIFGMAGYTPSITNCIVWGNIPDSLDGIRKVKYSNIEGSMGSGGPGVIDSDPLFVYSDAHDFHITYLSPCRNTGWNLGSGLPSTDFEKDPRIVDGVVDMGADEFNTHLYITGKPHPGETIKIVMIGVPNSNPAVFWVSAGILNPPVHTSFGVWYLSYPLIITWNMGMISNPDGTNILQFDIPPYITVPSNLYLQAAIGRKLTNLSELKLE